MKITKTHIHRLAAEMSCGCTASRTFSDAAFKEPTDEPTFTVCEKHPVGTAGVDILEMVLMDRLKEEAEKVPVVVAPVPGQRDPDLAAQGAPKIKLPAGIRVGSKVDKNPLPPVPGSGVVAGTTPLAGGEGKPRGIRRVAQ